MRLLGFERVELKAGESRRVTLTAAPRLLARFDIGTGQRRIAEGEHTITLGRPAGDPVLDGTVNLSGRLFGQ